MFLKQAFILSIIIIGIFNEHTTSSLSCDVKIKPPGVSKEEFDLYRSQCGYIKNHSFSNAIFSFFGLPPLKQWCYYIFIYLFEIIFELVSYKHSKPKLEQFGSDFAILIVLNIFAILISLLVNAKTTQIKIFICSFGVLFIKTTIDCSEDNRSPIQRITLQISFTALLLIAARRF